MIIERALVPTVFFGDSLVSSSSKKQKVVARSSIEVEYRAVALASYETLWLQSLLKELRVVEPHVPIVIM